MKRASLFSLSPLLLLAAALVALAVFFVHDARPAAAGHEETIWSATLNLPASQNGCSEFVGSSKCSTVLTDNVVTFRGVDYQITTLLSEAATYSSPGTAIFFDKALPAEFRAHLTLHVGSRALRLSDATVPSTGGNSGARWASAATLWSIGATVQLSITQDPAAALDTTFSADGKAATDFSNNADEAHAVAIQPDGKIVAAGFTNDGSNKDFALARYDSDGSLDTTFSTDGKVTTDFAGNADEARAVAIQPDGKIVAAGFANDGSDKNFALARYDPDGSLDTTFGTGGKVTTDFAGKDDEAYALAIQPDGKIVLAGYATNTNSSPNDTNDDHKDFALARYNPDGSLDASFSNDTTDFGHHAGKVTTLFNTNDAEIYALALQSDGKIVVAGRSWSGLNDDFALARFRPDGGRDISFGTPVGNIRRGNLTTDFAGTGDRAHAIAVQSDGKIVVAGRSWSGGTHNFALARYTAQGDLDTTFDNGGKVVTDINGDDVAHAVAVQSNGKIVVAGNIKNGDSIALARYTTHGNLDTSFDAAETGKAEIDVGNAADQARAIALQSDRKIVVAGFSNNGSDNDFAITRYVGGYLALNYLNYMGVSPNPNPRVSFPGQSSPGYYNVLHRSGSSADGLSRNISYQSQSAGPLTAWRMPASGYGWVVPSDPYTPAAGSPQQSVGSITLTPPFNPAVQEYSTTVPFEVSSVIITAVPAHSKATATVNGNSPSTPVSLEVGKNVVKVVVTADNGVQRTYTLAITREPNKPPTVASAIADASISNESGTHDVSLSGVFDDAEGDDLTVTASSSDESVATVSVSADYSTLTVSAQSRGTATITVTAADRYEGSVDDSFTVTVKSAPTVAVPIADVSELEVEATHEVSLSGVFSDGDGDSLTVTASSSDTSIAAVSVAIDGATFAITAVTVTANSEGMATITVTAQDADGNTVSDAFDVTVNAPAAQQQKVNNPPTVSSALADATIVSESGTHEASLSGVFDDADGDALTITASSSDESVVTVSVSADHSTLTVTAQARGTATVTVTAADGYGGSMEDSFTVRVKAAPVVASAISDVSSLEEGATRDISLSGVFSDADGDSLTVTAASSDNAKATVSVSAAGSKLTVSGVAEGTATITVTAQDADGNTVSDAFQVEVVQVPEPEPEPVELPGPVGNLQLTATHDSVSVSWSAPESGGAPDGYIVHLRPEGGAEGSGRTRTPRSDKTTVTFDNLESGRTYRVWVRAENAAGKGERVRASITLPAELPGPVTGLELTATADTVTVSWSAPETGGAPDGYIVHLNPDDGGKGRTKTPRAKKTKVSFENLDSGQTYKVWVRAQSKAGKGERVHASITLP